MISFRMLLITVLTMFAPLDQLVKRFFQRIISASLIKSKTGEKKKGRKVAGFKKTEIIALLLFDFLGLL